MLDQQNLRSLVIAGTTLKAVMPGLGLRVTCQPYCFESCDALPAELRVTASPSTTLKIVMLDQQNLGSLASPSNTLSL
jgi:hypothetical protein